MLKVRHLTISIETDREPLCPVEDVSFDVADGECFALVGESGCGKSMTALAMMRLLPEGASTVSGSVSVDDIDLMRLTEEQMQQWRGAKIAMIFQEPGTSLNPVMTVGDQIAEAVQLHQAVSRQQALEQALDWLRRVGIDEPHRRMNAYPFELSGGQKQRVVIAMALANNPRVVVADEPTTALDVTLQAQILDLLKTLQKQRKLSLLLITHDLAVVQKYADRVALMYAGQLLEQATADRFFSAPAHPYAQSLLAAVPRAESYGQNLPDIAGHVPPLWDLPQGCRFAPRCQRAGPQCSAPIPLRTLLQGHCVRCLKPYETSSSVTSRRSSLKKRGSPVLQLENLCVTYEKKRGLFCSSERFDAVKEVSLTVHAGQTVALVGESGSGKTTIGKAALGLLEGAKISGKVCICGADAFSNDRAVRWRNRRMAQIIFQDPFASLDPRMSIGETIAEGLRALMPEMDPKSRQEKVVKLLERVGLGPDAVKRLPHEFSGGQRQRVAIARALAVEPAVIVCDEPTSALDVSVQAQILNLLREIQEQTSVGLLFITHNFAVVEYLADSVAVLKDGRLVEFGEAQDVLCHPQEAYTRELLLAVPKIQ